MTGIEGMTAGQLREELRLTISEYTALRDQQHRTLKDHRAELENARQAERLNAVMRADVYAVAALRNLLDPLRRLLAQAGAIDEKTPAHRLERIAEQARSLASKLECDPDVVTAQRLAAEMDAAQRRLTGEKARLWDVLESVRQAVRPLTLAELQEREYDP
jgi:response regulator RpfG family c-di-GMP phosphodiesterase